MKGRSHQSGVCMGLGNEEETGVEGNCQTALLYKWVYGQKDAKK